MGVTEIGVLFAVAIITWLVVGVRLMNLCNVSGVSNGWLAFVPLLNYTRWARLAGKSPWLVLLWIIPLVGVILSLVWLHSISVKTASTSPWFWIVLIFSIASYAGVAIGGTSSFIISLIAAVLIIAALWNIFNPAKPINTSAAEPLDSSAAE